MADNENLNYENHDWEDGELITAQKMNNIESGIEAALNKTVSDEQLTRVVSENITADMIHAVSYEPYPENEGLTPQQQLQARQNIGAISSTDISNADNQIRISKNNDNVNAAFPILVGNTNVSELSNITQVEGQFNYNSNNNPTFNYSTGTLTAPKFSGSGAGLTSIPSDALENVKVAKLNGVVSINQGGTGAGNNVGARAQLQVLSAEDIAPAYNENTLYRKGDYCTKEVNASLGLYICKEATSGAWTSAHWQKIDISTIIKNLNSVATFTGVTSSSLEDGSAGLVPGPTTSDANKFLASDGTWQTAVTDIDFNTRTVTGTLSIANGGTGATSSADALSNLGAVSTDDLANAMGTIAEQYDENTSYNAGDYCIYNNKLYHCKAGEEITDESPDAEESEYWEEATVMDSIVDVAANLNPQSIGAATTAALKATSDNIMSNLASAYAAATSYAIGDYCTYNEHLYKCKVAVTGTAPVDGSNEDPYWTATTVDEAMELAAQAAAAAVSGVVRYDTNQSGILTSAQQDQARTNINAASLNDVTTASNNNVAVILNKIANAFSPLDTYEVGEYCIYQGNLYRCETKIEEPGEWNSNNWIGLNITEAISDIDIGTSINGGYVDNNNDLYLTYTVANQEPIIVAGPIAIPATGGGGTAGVIITLDNNNINIPTTVRNNNPCIFRISASSSAQLDILYITWLVNNVEYSMTDTNKNDGNVFEFDASEYLKPSFKSNKVKFIITSSAGGYISREFTVATTDFKIQWGEIIEPIKFYSTNMDVSTPIEVFAEKTTNVDVTLTIGSHTQSYNVTGRKTIQAVIDKSYFSAGVNLITASMASHTDNTDTAEDIHFVAIWSYGLTNPVVAFANNVQTCNQYDVVDINYFVYDPNNEEVNCSLQIGNNAVETITANRTIQTKQYSPLQAETITITLSYNLVSTTMSLTSIATNYTINYYDDISLLSYNVDPFGHNNSDSNREQFGSWKSYGPFTFSNNFNWEKGGFQIDENGAAAFVVKKGNRVILPRSLFNDSDVNGKTIDISFKITNSDQYDAIAIQDINSNDLADATKGIILRANNGEIRLNNNNGQEFRYCEETRIDLSILIESKATTQRVMTIWLDGIPSKANTYSDDMLNIEQGGQMPTMIIGSDHCDVWVYNLRTYIVPLTKQQMIQNYISCGNNTEEKINRYKQNNIFDEDDKVDMSLLHTAMPNLTLIEIEMPKMTINKDDKVPSKVTITDGANQIILPAASSPNAGDGTIVKVQGTSSAAYGRSAYNLDIDFKNTDQTYKISENSIEVNYLTVKVNVASSENANNINAVDWYNTYQPYKLPYRNIPGVRDTVEGKPCAVFVTNNSGEDKWFSSQYVLDGETILYAMGDLCNSKKNTAVFAQDGVSSEINPYPTKGCIEVSGNDTAPEQFLGMQDKGQNVVYNAEDEEWQTTETVIENGENKIKKIKHFEWRMKPKSADINDVVQAWNDTVNWVASTRNNSTKFKAEVENYFAIESLLYHFLFIEYFAAYDNVSKNTFYSFDYDENADSSIWNGYRWNINKAYDMDTILACDNDGIPLGDYGIDYGDMYNGNSFFNAVSNPIWTNIKEAYQTELSNLYAELRTAGAWNNINIIAKWDNYQHRRPAAAMMVDAYNKYIAPYQTHNLPNPSGNTLGYDSSYLPRMQGSKTYWRRQFLTYQTSYMDGKYGYYVKSDSTLFRANSSDNDPTRDFIIKAYAKTYITMLSDNNTVGSLKINTGDTNTFTDVSASNNITLYVTPQNLIQYIKPLNNSSISTFTAPGATKLTEAILGGEEINNRWDSSTEMSIPSVVLKILSIRNMTNFTSSLDLKNNVELETLDTRGTKAGIITLPNSAPLNSIQLNACTGIIARNLNNIDTFTMESGENLSSILVENCNNIFSNKIKEYLITAADTVKNITKRVRITDINWELDNIDAIYKIATSWKGYNNLGEEQDKPVITGTIKATNASIRKLQAIHNVWGSGEFTTTTEEIDEEVNGETVPVEYHVWTSTNLTIKYKNVISSFTVSFINLDGTAIKDTNNNNYTQQVDYNDLAIEPVSAGYINTPTYGPLNGKVYTYAGWKISTSDNENNNNSLFDFTTTRITNNITLVVSYTKADQTFTVTWYSYDNAPNPVIAEGVLYGSEVRYQDYSTNNQKFPTRDPYSGVYYVFKGWNKNTGYITNNTTVVGQWESSAALPYESTQTMNDSTVAQIYATAIQNKLDSTNFRLPQNWVANSNTYKDIVVGRNFNYTGIESKTIIEADNPNAIINQPVYFDGSSSGVKIFDGTNNLDAIQLFGSNSSSFTLAIDFEYTNAPSSIGDDDACILSCLDSGGNSGNGLEITMPYNSRGATPVVRWGNATPQVVGGKYNRNIVVIRYNKGKNQLFVNYNNTNGANYAGTIGTTNNNVPMAYSNDFNFAANGYLVLGGIADSTRATGNRATGWIHWCKIWYQNLGEEDAITMAAWPHETWRLLYTGLSKRQPGGSSDAYKTNMEFILNNALPLKYTFGSNNNWANSNIRNLLNDHIVTNEYDEQKLVYSPVFAALPIEWQYLIKTVNITSTSNNSSSTTEDKLYLPSVEEINGVSGISGIPFFTPGGANPTRTRVYFPGVIMSNMNWITGTKEQDPTTYTTVQSGKTIWVITGRDPDNGNYGRRFQSAYIYYDADYCNKHKIICGRMINENSDYILVPQGQDYANGRWILAESWYTRSGSNNDTYYVYQTYESGGVDASGWAQESTAIVFEFCI